MRAIYRLRDDAEHIGQVQRATLSTDQFGIEPTHGLFGSDEWWQQISSHRLPTHTLKGTISRLYMGDWPEFELLESDGTKHQWSRYANSPADAKSYQLGRAVEVDYVVQRFRPKAWKPNEATKVVLEVRVEDVA